MKRRIGWRAGVVLAMFWMTMLAACGPAPQSPAQAAPEARREEPRRDPARPDEARRDDGENREAREAREDSEGRRHKSKSERRREREERVGEPGDENRATVDRSSGGGNSYGGAAATNAAGQPHDLSADEAQGGHTLRKHVGRTDAQLQERLEQEGNISAASTWTDRATAEATVGSALAANGSKIEQWTGRGGRRPNLAIDYRGDASRPIGRCMQRGSTTAVPATDAIVVLKAADGGDGYFVLTTYPECPR
ncbi:MAG TPA: RNase A-like domain-containing protein [Candidatus Acidoferrales bacterium]